MTEVSYVPELPNKLCAASRCAHDIVSEVIELTVEYATDGALAPHERNSSENRMNNG